MPNIFKSRGITPPLEKYKIPEEPFVYEEIPEEEPNPEAGEEEASEDVDASEESSLEDMFVESVFTVVEEPEEEVPDEPILPEPLTDEEIAELYKEDIQRVIEEASYKAYNDMIVKKRGELSECIENVDAKLKEIQKVHTEFIDKYAEELKYFAIEIAEKMIIKKIEEDELILETLVMNTVGTIKNTSWLDVELSENLVGLVEKIRENLEDARAVVTITPISGAIDTIRVNTEEGTIVSGISAQADNLRKIFKEN